jgi:thioredoxin 1
MNVNRLLIVCIFATLSICAKPKAASRVTEFQITRSKSSLEAFKQRIERGHVVVDFYAPWCGPCKRIAPIFGELSNVYTNVTFIKVNIDDHKEIAMQYKIRSIPQLLFFKDGCLVETFVGQKSKSDIQRALNKHFKLQTAE